MYSSLERLVLVLNASYEPINVTSARNAIKLVMKGKAAVEVHSSHTVSTSRFEFPIPNVIRLTVYRKMPRFNRSVSRKGILMRDKNTCQYCSAKLPVNRLTKDHVIPRARGGASTWENLVACCYPCNNKKGDRTPDEAGMPLVKQPRQINIHTRHRLLAADEAAWDKYLFC